MVLSQALRRLITETEAGMSETAEYRIVRAAVQAKLTSVRRDIQIRRDEITALKTCLSELTTQERHLTEFLERTGK